VADTWDVLTHDLVDSNPAEARRIFRECSYSDIAFAVCVKKRGTEGVGYKVEYK